MKRFYIVLTTMIAMVIAIGFLTARLIYNNTNEATLETNTSIEWDVTIRQKISIPVAIVANGIGVYGSPELYIEKNWPTLDNIECNYTSIADLNGTKSVFLYNCIAERSNSHDESEKQIIE